MHTLIATEWIVAICIAVVVPVVVVATMFRRKPAPKAEAKAPEPPAPAARPKTVQTPARPPTAQSPAARPARTPTAQAPALSPSQPATLEVQALAPSATGEMPMLDDPEPMFDSGSGEAPQLAAYRTLAANQLAEAIHSTTCPKCKSPTFVGRETPQGDNMFQLEGRCGACGHKATLIDVRV